MDTKELTKRSDILAVPRDIEGFPSELVRVGVLLVPVGGHVLLLVHGEGAVSRPEFF